MKTIIKIKFAMMLLLAVTFIWPFPALSQGNPAIDKTTIEKTINKTAKLMSENYVFPDAAKKMGEHIKNKLAAGGYDGITDPFAFCDTLTADLQSISKDKHIRVRYNPEEIKRMKDAEKDGHNDELEKQFLADLKNDNYGFVKVERLSGNIGYVDFRMFAPAQYSKETVASVMAFLLNTDAIIFDIRKNGGGNPDGVQLICSYLFGKKSVHLNDIYSRPDDKLEEFWTLNKVDGEKMPDKPVYVLTSSYTFSGAEEFAYNLKNLKRATIIGEVTGGGANPGDVVPINDMFGVFIPTGRAINPYTNTNWEGTGVQPDVVISSDKALDKAMILALQNKLSKIKDEQEKKQLNWYIESLQSAFIAPELGEDLKLKFAGLYGDRNITIENGSLFYQRGKRAKYEMTYIGDNTFMFKELEYFRVRFESNSEGKITELTGIYDDGRTDKSVRK